MKYFDENNKIIKALLGLEFLSPKLEPVIDNAGGLGAGIAYKQMLIKLQEAKEELKKRQEEAEQKKLEEARRPRAVLSLGKVPPQNSQLTNLDRMRQEQRSQMISSDPNGTSHMLASVLMLPYLGLVTRQYFSRPTEEIISGELYTLNHTLNPFMVSDDMFLAAKEQSRQGHSLGAMGLGFTGFGLGALTASPVKTVATTGVTATKRAAQGIKLAAKTATENVGARMDAAMEGFNSYSPAPAYQPYVFADGTIGLMPGNYNQMNFIKELGLRVKSAWNGFKAKPTTAAESTTAEATSGLDNEILSDIRYPGARHKRVKVIKREVGHELDGKPIDPEQLKYEQDLPNALIEGKYEVVEPRLVETTIPGTPGQSGYYVDKLGNRYYGENPPTSFDGINPQVKQIDAVPEVPETTKIETQYFYNGNPLDKGTAIFEDGKWFKLNGKWRHESDIKEVLKEVRVKPGEEIPEGAEFLNRKTGWSESLEGKVFRTPTGWGRNSYIYADGTPVEWYKNPGFYKKAGVWGGGTLALIGLPNAGTIVKGAAEGSTTGNGVVPGIIKAFREKFKSETDSTQSEDTNDSIQAVLAALKRALEVEDSIKQAQFQSKQDLYNRNVKR